MSQKAAMRQRRRAAIGCRDVAVGMRKWTKVPRRTQVGKAKK